ncbi:AMP-binding protein [Phenylobacterium sp. LH3H17]|uniref:AMP-binding protein n=1 Tax=Phenylobacterium sp. LH3H17 TaxID=2903901 RepID=UPI0020C9B581|nr:AMP-binding protein [Phenylobacterium sp. LH3H17]UTP38186.1 AMP-binding protein [Phenylobacterium sp. LH3H17]
MYKVTLTESYFPAQQDDFVLPLTVGGGLRAQARETPEAPALIETDAQGHLSRRWTYGELLAEAERLARALLSRYRPGDRIAVWAPNIPEWVIIEYAAALAGLVLVTVNPAYRARELTFVLEQSRSSGLFLVSEHRSNPMARIAAEVLGELADVREVVDLRDRAALFAGADQDIDLPDVQPDDAVQIQYTSGTTGFPKGAVLHHRGIMNNVRFMEARLGRARGETAVCVLPMFHTSGCVGGVLGALTNGGALILPPAFDPAVLLDLVEREGITFVTGVPTMLVAILEAQAARSRDVASIRSVGSGGSMVPPDLIRRIRDTFQCRFLTVYGQTETSPLLTSTFLDDAIEDGSETIGQALPQTELSIRDPKTNAVLPIGQVGEICARGYALMLGYNDNPDATAATIDADGWLHTGDLGSMDARGYLRITGRVKEMIIRGGENLFPAEIENAMLEHPDVLEIAVVGIPDDKWGEVVACFLRLRHGAVLDRPALTAHCRERLAAPKTPAHWIEVQEWPLTGSGKIQKFVLRDQFISGALQSAATPA